MGKDPIPKSGSDFLTFLFSPALSFPLGTFLDRKGGLKAAL